MTDITQLSDEELQRMLQAQSAFDVKSMSNDDLLKAIGSQSAPSMTSRIIDPTKAGASLGVRATIPGFPVDRALDVVDLSRAFGGYVGNKLGMTSASEMPDLINRANVPFSGEWNANRVRASDKSTPEWMPQFLRGAPIDNPYPDDPVAKASYAGGQAGASTLAFGPTGGARNAALGYLSGVSGNVAEQAGLPPSGQLLASMAVPATVTTASRMAQTKLDRLAQAKIHNATRDENVTQARDAGYVMSPIDVNIHEPGMLNRGITMLGGKKAMQDAAALKNDVLADNATRRDLGIPMTSKIDDVTLAQVRFDAGASGYAPVRAIKNIPVDNTYISDIGKLRAEYLRDTQGSASLQSATAEKALSSAQRLSYTGDAAVSLTSKLREAGFKGQQSTSYDERAGGAYQRKVAEAIDDLAQRHLQRNGTSQQYRDYIDARRMIAKAHTYENALDKGSGHIDARKLAKEWQDGAPLDGEALKLAKAAAVLQQSLGQVKSANPAMGMFGGGSMVSSALLAAMTQDPRFLAGMVLPVIPPAARKIAMSGPYQRRFAKPADYKSSWMTQLLPELFPQDMGGLLGAYAVPPRD